MHSFKWRPAAPGHEVRGLSPVRDSPPQQPPSRKSPSMEPVPIGDGTISGSARPAKESGGGAPPPAPPHRPPPPPPHPPECPCPHNPLTRRPRPARPSPTAARPRTRPSQPVYLTRED